QNGLSFEKQLNINVNDINEAPTDLLLDNTAIDEGQTDGVIGNLISIDPDTRNTFTYSLVTGTGATDNSLFTITNNQLKTNAVFDFETQTIYSIRVKTTDQNGLSFEKQLNINVNDINEAPTDLLLDNTAIDEGQTDGVIGNLISIDPDTRNTFTYSLVTGTGDTENSLFSIVDNQLIANTVFDFETQTIYSIRVKTTDQNGLSFERQLNINVNDINEAPTDLSYDNNTDTTTIDEGKPIGTVVGNLSSTDPDTGNTFTYSLVTGDGATDNSLFTITGNQLKTNSVFDFETKNSYSIRVKTTDQNGLSFERQLTIGVTNVPEAPTLNRPSSGNTFVLKGDSNERLEVKLTGYNSKLNSELGVFTVDDANGTIDGIAPGAAGYTDKALQRGQVIFSLLGNSPVGFNQSSLSRLLELNSNSNLRFYLVKDGSTDSVLNNTTPKTNVLFDISSNVRTTTLGNGFSLAWEDGSGNTAGFEDLQVTITPTDIIPTDTVISQVTSLQNKPQGELLDLRGINGPVKADFVVNREAAYNNFVGFYKVADENGGIDTNGDGSADILPEQAGYAQAAVRGRVSDLALAVNNNGTATFNNKTLQGGSVFAPFIITNGGTPDNYDNINSRIYFTFGAANSDGVDHVRLLGDNTFGFEDLTGGGDKDFNDVIVKVNLTV
ncbi:cadherin domain-containing protein, partial [Anabaena sp. FACHB-1391]|uniref:cadherin domain-containing protein n=1 Tax=Anabaena sp. FACHB-1391 TaxID=2692771 RepID=UPI0016805C22